jgi:PKD repeat protein
MDSDRGVSEIVGAMLLVSLVIIGVMIVSVAVLSQPPPEDIPQVTALAENISKTVYLYHNGGDSLQPNEIRVLVNGENSSFSLANSEQWPWSAGKTLKVDYTGPGMPRYVQLIYTGGSTQTLILTAYFVPPIITGGPTSIPTTSPPTMPTTIITTIPTTSPTTTATTPPICDPLIADFTRTPSSGYVPLTVQFNDQSTPQPQIIGWNWNFGDGYSSIQQNPSHTYTSVSVYLVTLTVRNTCGNSNSTQKYIQVLNCPPINPDFSASETQSCGVPFMVQFNDLSSPNPVSWLWNFGDGGTSTGQNPSHLYQDPGLYTVTLSVTDSCGNFYIKSKPSFIIAASTTYSSGIIPLLSSKTGCDASLGYNNPNSYPVCIPIGPNDNKFDPGSNDRGQPTLFLPGIHNNVFTIVIDHPNLKWHLSPPNFDLQLNC